MRLPDWPERLEAAIRAAELKTFGGDYYCVTFAADCIHAMTGEDPMAGYRNCSMPEALAALHRDYRHYCDFLVKHFGRSQHISKAQRGDIVLRLKPELSTGICLGHVTAFPAELGVAMYPTLLQSWCYKVS